MARTSSSFVFLANSAVFLAAALVGCEGGAMPVDASVSIDAQSTIEPDAWAPGEDASTGDGGLAYPIDIPCEGECTLTWRELAPYVAPTDHHSTFIIEHADGPYLYVLGGMQPDTRSTLAGNARVSAAPILGDGTLGPWQHDEDVGGALAMQAQVQVELEGSTTVAWLGGLLFRGGSAGYLADFPMAVFEHESPGPALSGFGFGGVPGTELVALTADTALPIRGHTSASAIRSADGQLTYYGIGGEDPRSGEFNAEVRRWAAPEPGGMRGSAVLDAPLPEPRSHHTVVVIDGRLVVIGGLLGSLRAPALAPAILRSVHDPATHAITGWETIQTWAEAPAVAASFVREGYVYVLGGVGGPSFVDAVARAEVLADGTLGPFEAVAGPLPMARGHVHQTPVWGRYVYSVGGRIVRGGALESSARVFVGTFVE